MLLINSRSECHGNDATFFIKHSWNSVYTNIHILIIISLLGRDNTNLLSSEGFINSIMGVGGWGEPKEPVTGAFVSSEKPPITAF